MYKKDLDALIYNKKVPNFILLRGNDEFQNELYAKRLIRYFASENLLSLYFVEYDFEIAREFFEPSLFGGNNTLYIKTSTAIKKSEISTLIKFCEEDLQNHLIVELNDDGYVTPKDFINAFGKNDVRIFKPNNINEAISLLSQKCEQEGIFANSAALREIYRIHNENLNLSASEIEKFANLKFELNIENVKAMVSGLSEVSYDEMVKSLLNLEDFRVKFYKLIQSGGYNEIEFINYFYGAIYRIFKLHTFIKSYGKADFRAVFGYVPPSNVINFMQNIAMNFSTKLFQEIFQTLSELDFDLKTKKPNAKDEFLLSYLLKIQRIIQTTNRLKSKN